MADIFARICVSFAALPGDGGLSPGAAAPNGPSGYSSRERRKLVSTIFLIVGVVLLVLALGAYTWMSIEQHELETNWQAESAKSAAASAQGNSTAARVTLLSIPKIKLQAAILEGTTRKSLMLAPGHLESTAWPGDPGNSVIAGHRDTFFRHIHELNKGDDIYVRRGTREYHYVVISKAIVGPDDIAVTYPTKDTRLTLVTCYPTYYIGPAPKRLVVVATFQPGSTTAASGHTTESNPSQ
ncbi:MAG TPA: class D sortase [Terriglobales bacterium]|nr:class D sortase [Terriglobales bacterium]